MLLFLLAQAEAAVAAPPPAPAAAQGVQSYGPAFFAAQNPNSALDMVGRLPAFTLDTGDVVRGFEGAAGNVLIDGQRPASKSDTLDVILQRLPASKVARIDVIRGGAPGIDMQGKTVIANVITKTGGGAHGLLAVSNYHVNGRGDFGSLRAEASGALGESTWEAALRSDATPDDAVNTGRSVLIFADGSPTQEALLESHGADTSQTATGAVETPLLGGKLRINGRLQRDKFKEPETDRIIAPAPDIQNFFATQHTTDTEIGGRFSRAFGPATDLELVALRTTRDRSNDSSAAIDGSTSDFLAKATSSEGILRAVAKHRFGARFSVEAGAETADNRLDSRTRFSVDGANQPLPAANVRVEEKRTEAFLKTAWSPGPKWTVEADVRYETSDISSSGDVVLAKSLQFAKPRLAVSWTPVAATQVRLRLERTVGQLDFNDFVAAASLINSVGVTAGNPDLNPQQAWVSEVAVEQQLWMGASVILTARHSALSDVVDRGPVFAANGAVFDRPTNIGSGTEDDFIVEFTLPFDRFGWKGALLSGTAVHRESEVTDPTTGRKREISNLHPNDWRASFSQDLPRWNLNLGVDLSGQFRQTTYRFNLIETLKLTTSVRPYAEWKPRPDLSVRLEVPLVTEPNVRLRDTLQVFPGPRGAGGLPDIQDRQFHFPRGWSVRLLKNFG
jgi:outer membrane receptor protein involved in Fe transport